MPRAQILTPPHSSAPRVSVVIPTLNEAKNLPHVFSRLPRDLHEVILVDGRSSDGTIEMAEILRPDVRIVRQNRKGKGNAFNGESNLNTWRGGLGVLRALAVERVNGKGRVAVRRAVPAPVPADVPASVVSVVPVPRESQETVLARTA